MTEYFQNINTMPDLKKRYKELAKQYHPDIYGKDGNEIMKEVHAQLEKAIKGLDRDYFKSNEVEDDDEITKMKKQFAKDAMNSQNPENALFASYFINNLKPQVHKNPLTQKLFHGNNVWTLELQYLLKGYKSCEWSTFMQYKSAEKTINKGEKATSLILAVHSKEKDENGEEQEKFRFYKPYKVFNIEQTKEWQETHAGNDKILNYTETKLLQSA